MTGFLNASGTSACIGGYMLPFSSFDEADMEVRFARPWLSVEELAVYDPFNENDFDFEFCLDDIFDEGDLNYEDACAIELVVLDTTGIIDLRTDDNPYRNFYPTYWDYDYGAECQLPERDSLAVVREGEYVYAICCELFGETYSEHEPIEYDFDEVEEPSFRAGVRYNRPLTWDEGDFKWGRKWRSRHSRKTAKFRIDGKLARKDNRDHRIGNRQCFADRRDYWADVYDIYAELAKEWNRSEIPTYDIAMVGMVEEEASFYEADFDREAMNDQLPWYLDDHSDDFDPVTNGIKVEEVWERHLFPERFEDHEPYRFSDWYYDDWGWDYVGGMDYEPYDDYLMRADSEYDDEFEYDGPTLEEWLELDMIANDLMLEDEADRFTPSFIGSSRSNLRYHITEPRRGKLKRKYGKSTSHFYRDGRPYKATAATN